MKPTLFSEASKVWKRLGSDLPYSQKEFELDLQNRLLQIFQVGDFYYYIFNLVDLKFDLMSKEVKQVLGYNPEEFVPAVFLESIHPEDQPWFLLYEDNVQKFFSQLAQEQIPNYKVRYDYRMRKKDGTYIRVQHQVITIDYDSEGRLIRTLGVHTDISHLKQEGKPVLSFIGLNGQPAYLNITTEDFFQKPTFSLTPRECEIVSLLAKGKQSKEIAILLNISLQTVHTHRKNLLAKTEALNTIDLVAKAIAAGWI